MVGGLCGAFGGIGSFPADWIEKLEASYGTDQHISSQGYHTGIFMMLDQRDLARRITEIIMHKARERQAALTRLYCLERCPPR